MSGATRTRALALYHQFLREASRFQDYNFRKYAVRKVKRDFRANRTAVEPQTSQLLLRGEQELASLRRQVIVNALYAGDKSVIEVLGRDR